ncbi:type IV secretion protein Rhs, partial [Muribacter muris]
FNQLITFNDKAQHQWHYKYDGLGRRIEKYSERDNTTTKYIWDGDQLALTQTFKRDKLIHQRHSVFHGWELLAQQDSYQDKQTTHYAVSQPNGKILGLFTPEGELTWKAEKRTLWGICFDWYQFKYPNPLDPEMLFAGQWLDSESGLAYNRFRYYDPETGNYLCLDPIGLSGGETPYAYVHNPWDWLDPLGLARCHGLPSTRKAGGTGKNYDPLNGQGLYILRDPITNQIKYVGRGDAPARGIAHKQSHDKGHLVQEIIAKNNLTKAEAKYLEQRLIDHFGGAKSTNPSTNLMNKIRSYSKFNPNSGTYSVAGDSTKWGDEIFSDILNGLK